MDFLSILAGVDSLRKLAVIAGLILICIGVTFPVQKAFELTDKKIVFEENKKLNSVELDYLNREIKKIDIVIKSNTTKVSDLNSKKDSLLKCNSNDDVKTKLDFVRNELTNIKASDEAVIVKLKEQILSHEKAQIKSESIQCEVENLAWYIKFYFGGLILFVGLGLYLFTNGLRKWNASQKESDELKKIEVQIKAEELKKAQRENGNS